MGHDSISSLILLRRTKTVAKPIITRSHIGQSITAEALFSISIQYDYDQ